MTEKQDTAEAESRNPEEAAKRRAIEALRARALRAFGQSTIDATAAFERELADRAGKGEFAAVKIRDLMPYGEDYRMASAITAAVGFAFLPNADGSEFALGFDDRQTLQRLYEALRPPTKPKFAAIDLAAHLVEEYAEMYTAAGTQRDPPPQVHDLLPTQWMSRDDLARHLVTMLAVRVHREFAALKNKLTDVELLLGRYTSGSDFHTEDGAASKLSANGILEKLNELASFIDPDGVHDRPLGSALNQRGIANAIAKARIASSAK